QLLLAHAGRARDVESLRDLRQRAAAHVLERRDLQLLGRRRAARPLRLSLLPCAAIRLGGRRLLLGGCRRGGTFRFYAAFGSRAIRCHSSFNPSPLPAATAA